MKPFKKGTKVDFLGYDYLIESITDTDVRMRRVGSKDKESVVTLKIGSKRFNKIFLGNYEGAYNKILEAEEILDVDIESKSSDELSIVIFKDIVDSLRTGSGFFKSKTEATLWCLEALSDSSEIKEYFKNPLYTLLSLYYHKTELTEVTESAVEKYINTSGFRDKFTDFFKFKEEVLKGNSDVGELMTYIPDDYEDIVLEFLLGRVQLNVTLKDLKYIIQQYERQNIMAKDNGLKVFSDEEISKLSNLFGSEAAARGLAGDDVDSDSDVDLAELLEDMDAKEVLELAKEAGATIRATKKTLELSPEELAELLEEKLDEEQMEAFMELLDGAEDEDADEDEESELAELLEEAMEEDSITDILDGAGVEVKLTAKQKKMGAEELAELLESKLDEDDMDALLEYLAGEESDEDEDDEEEDEDGAELAELLEEVMESEDIVDILEEAGVEIKLTAKQKKFDAEAMAELLESKLDEDDLESLMGYLSEYEAEDEDADEDDEEETEDDGDEDINIDDLDDEEILELAEEEGIEFKKVKGKVNPKEMERIKAELKEMYE